MTLEAGTQPAENTVQTEAAAPQPEKKTVPLAARIAIGIVAAVVCTVGGAALADALSGDKEPTKVEDTKTEPKTEPVVEPVVDEENPIDVDLKDGVQISDAQAAEALDLGWSVGAENDQVGTAYLCSFYEDEPQAAIDLMNSGAGGVFTDAQVAASFDRNC